MEAAQQIEDEVQVQPQNHLAAAQQEIIDRGPQNNLETDELFEFDRQEILLGIYSPSLEKVKKK